METNRKIQVNMEVWKCTNPSKQGSQSQMFPTRFLRNLERVYPTKDKKVLWMFSGSMKGDKNNITTDIRKETGADIISSYDKLPIEDNSFDMIIADPPYNQLFAKEWKADLPKPKRIIQEALRILRPEGILILLHIVVTPTYQNSLNHQGHCFKRIGLHPVLCGLHNAIRVTNVLQKTKQKGGLNSSQP
jgi:SAM-dependent methyltransferase